MLVEENDRMMLNFCNAIFIGKAIQNHEALEFDLETTIIQSQDTHVS